MFVPTLGVLAARITSGASLDIEWNRLPWRWLAVALLLLPVAIHAVALPGGFLWNESCRGFHCSYLAGEMSIRKLNANTVS
jgi:hypothetical protein